MRFTEHLGPRAASLVDGELAHDDRDRALAHLAGCAKCRALVEAERRLKGQLGAMVMPEPPARLIAALFQAARQGSDPILDAVDALAQAAAPLLDVEGRLQQIMGDAYRPPSRDLPASSSAHENWFASSLAGTQGGAIEVAFRDGVVAARDSGDPDGPVLRFTPDEWEALLRDARWRSSE